MRADTGSSLLAFDAV